MIIELRRLGAALLSLAISLTIVALATSSWPCGNLFTDCQRSSNKETAAAVAGLLLAGLICLVIILLMDIVALCSDSFAVRNSYITGRFVLLYLGAILLLIGILVYTSLIGRQWSYLLAVSGTIMAVQVAILAIMSSKCVTVHTTSARTYRETRVERR